jgi:hypothetical protein
LSGRDHIKIEDRGVEFLAEQASILPERIDSHGVDHTVSVLPRELMKKPETLIPSVVRLYGFQPIAELVGEFLYPVLFSEGVGVSEDRELDGFGLKIKGWVLSQSEQRQLIGEVVQGGAQVSSTEPVSRAMGLRR